MNIQYQLQKITSVFRILVLIGLVCIFASSGFSQTKDLELSKLGQQFATEYLSPESHFALAQYYLDKGNKVQAFYILESARRNRFSSEEFDPAFVNYFGDYSPEPSDEAKRHFEEGYRLVELKNLAEAEQSLIKAANLGAKSYYIQAWVGRFYLKLKNDEQTALKYYYNAYFINTHAYDTEYAESRIRKIIFPLAELEFAKLVKSGKSLDEIATDENPLLVMKAVQAMSKNWKSEYLDTLFKTMENDDSMVRWASFETALRNSKNSTLDEFILRLQTDKDLRKRGLSAYAIIERGQEKDFETLKQMLANDVELIRFDAVSALALQGGERGSEMLRLHQKKETNSYLLRLLDKTFQPE